MKERDYPSDETLIAAANLVAKFGAPNNDLNKFMVFMQEDDDQEDDDLEELTAAGILKVHEIISKRLDKQQGSGDLDAKDHTTQRPERSLCEDESGSGS